MQAGRQLRKQLENVFATSAGSRTPAEGFGRTVLSGLSALPMSPLVAGDGRIRSDLPRGRGSAVSVMHPSRFTEAAALALSLVKHFFFFFLPLSDSIM